MNFKEYSFLSLLSDIVDNRGKTVPTEDTGIALIATNCIKNENLYPATIKLGMYQSAYMKHGLEVILSPEI
ncbi:hypothetical protein AI19_12115 [Thalassolituus oleivorans 4BN06-13]|nr:hypothetical protein [Thalassolituus oleivorans 4BN06-13]